jgi:hypothetical protein
MKIRQLCAKIEQTKNRTPLLLEESPGMVEEFSEYGSILAGKATKRLQSNSFRVALDPCFTPLPVFTGSYAILLFKKLCKFRGVREAGIQRNMSDTFIPFF